MGQLAESLITPTLNENGIEIVDIEYLKEQGRWVLRIFIDHENGVNLETCEKASRMISGVLDNSDFIAQSYVLEVSSPGLDRIIKKDRDFIRFSGHKAKIKTFEAIEGQKKFVGILQGLENDHVLLEVDGKEIRLPRSNVKQVKLVVEL
ncbi:MAG: ribosome maturation factor RimP [Syntrophomonadaceae bacterium]|nr:ribosome maturation factor RimP [Syntrophomonadaceae bacterium]